MPVSFLSPAQRDSYGRYLGDPGAAMVSGPALVRALERLNAVRSLSITVPAAAAIAPTRIAALARFAEKAKVTAVARLPALRRTATLVAFVHSLEASAQDAGGPRPASRRWPLGASRRRGETVTARPRAHQPAGTLLVRRT